MSIIAYPRTSKSSPSARRHVIDVILPIVLWLLIGLLSFILVLPIPILFLTTAVPIGVTIGLAVVDASLTVALFRLKRTWRTVSMFVCGIVVVALLAVWLSQSFAATRPIMDTQGQPIPASIASLERVQLGGSEQWITIRGKDRHNPVLLYLGIGGPGAGGFPANALTLSPLEDYFVVVNWDQPGTGKSYDAVAIPNLTVERFIADAHELTQLLRTRFQQDKIYVMGLSWGSILGIQLVQRYPDLFHAYVGTGQMVNTTENDVLGYHLALQIATERNEFATVEKLRRNGPPPYTGRGMAMKYALYNNILFRYMDSPTLELILLLVPQFAPEYGLVDRVNFARGLIESFAVVYPQLESLDFTSQAAQLDLPVYFLVGRHDVNAMASLVERYYNVLQAPRKELIWLESGHGASAEQIRDAMVNHVLAQTLPTP